MNKDGLLDILCGGQRGFVNFFKNIGSVSAPMFSNIPTNDTLGCIVLQGIGTTDGFTVPFFYDSLGSTRLLLASEDGNINQYNQIDGNLNGCFNLSGKIYDPAESKRIKFNITVSGGNLNGDNLTDIIIGQSTGGAEIRYQVDPTAGVSEIGEIKPVLEIYPNPVSDNLKIYFYNLKNRAAKICVFNSLGEIVSVKNINRDNLELNTSNWAAGIYFIQLTAGNYSVGKKLIVGK